MWYTDKEIVHYEKCYNIPGWITLLPTADYEVYIFKLQSEEKQYIFSFNYYDTLVFLKSKVSNGKIKLELFIEKGQESEDFFHDRCLIWLGSYDKIKSNDTKPEINKKYRISRGCEISMEMKICKNICFGFYNGPDY